MSKQPGNVPLTWRFGDRVRELRERRGLTLRAFATLSRLDYRTVHAIEKGRRNVGVLTIHVLARWLGVRAADLFTEG